MIEEFCAIVSYMTTPYTVPIIVLDKGHVEGLTMKLSWRRFNSRMHMDACGAARFRGQRRAAPDLLHGSQAQVVATTVFLRTNLIISHPPNA